VGIKIKTPFKVREPEENRRRNLRLKKERQNEPIMLNVDETTKIFHILDYIWHIGANYEFSKLNRVAPNFELTFCERFKAWDESMRPRPTGCRFRSGIPGPTLGAPEWAGMDCVILHNDHYCFFPIPDRRLMLALLEQVSTHMAVILLWHGLFSPALVERLKRILPVHAVVVVNAEEVRRQAVQLGLRNCFFILHGLEAEEWPLAEPDPEPRFALPPMVAAGFAGLHRRDALGAQQAWYGRVDELELLSNEILNKCIVLVGQREAVWLHAVPSVIQRTINTSFDAYRKVLQTFWATINTGLGPNPRFRAEGMMMGLIPVTSPNFFQDPDYSVLLEKEAAFTFTSAEELQTILRTISRWSLSALRSRQALVRGVAQEKFSLKAYLNKWKEIIRLALEFAERKFG